MHRCNHHNRMIRRPTFRPIWAVETHFKNPRFFRFLKKPKNLTFEFSSQNFYFFVSNSVNINWICYYFVTLNIAVGDRTKWYWTKWQGQNGTTKWQGQNGSNFYRFQFN